MVNGAQGPELDLRGDGVIAYDGLVIGKWTAETKMIMLDAGWMDMAGIGFVIRGNPEVDARKVLAKRDSPKLKASREKAEE